MNLEVWKPSFNIPQSLFDRANLVKSVPNDGRVKGFPVQVSWQYDSVAFDIILTDGYFIWHDDKHYHSEYSCGLILRNDTSSWIEVAGQPKIQQNVGTMVSLNIHKKHRLNCFGGRHGIPGVWVGLMKDSEEYLTKQQWEDKYASLFEKMPT